MINISQLLPLLFLINLMQTTYCMETTQQSSTVLQLIYDNQIDELHTFLQAHSRFDINKAGRKGGLTWFMCAVKLNRPEIALLLLQEHGANKDLTYQPLYGLPESFADKIAQWQDDKKLLAAVAVACGSLSKQKQNNLL